MKRFLRASLLVSAFSLLFFVSSGSLFAHAQTPPPTPLPAGGTPIADPQDNGRVCKKYPSGVLPDGDIACLNTNGTTAICKVVEYVSPSIPGSSEDSGSSTTVFCNNSDGTRTDVHGSQTGDPVTANRDAAGNTSYSRASDGVESKCTLGDLTQCFLNIPGYLLSGIAYAILVLSTLVLWVAGTVYNWVVIRTVFQFALYFGTSDGMLVAWKILRDIANIALLFGFVFVGIATILNTSGMEGYTAKKALPRLIIFAVLLNFSLFATQGIIDVANGFASIFSTYAGQGDCTAANETGTAGQGSEECANVGISGKIMAAAGMNHFPTAEGFTGTIDKPYSSAAMLIILSILVSITAMVLFAGSIMLIIRVVVLSLLMVTSPIGFAGLAIPSLQKIAQDWWHKLINQAFFAPLYLLMVFVSLKLLDGLQSGDASIPDAIAGNTAGGGTIAGNMQVVVVYAIVIGFMIGSIMVAQKMGAAGASFATKTAGGLAFGAQGFVGRRTLGRLSAAGAHAVKNSAWAEKNPGLARLAYGSLNKGATASFSARNAMGGLLGGAGAKIDIGKANKVVGHGYHGIEEKAEKERLDFAKGLVDRDETKQERDIRVAQEEAQLRTMSEKNSQEIIATGTEVATANENKKVAEEHLAARQFALREQRGVLARFGSTGDPEAEALLKEEEANVARAEQELATADKGFADATRKLAAAENDRTKIAATQIDRNIKKDAVSAKSRQEVYARSLIRENTGWGTIPNTLTAGGHGNHEAARKILKGMQKDEYARMADMLRDAQKKRDSEKEEAPHSPQPATTGAPPTTPDPHH